VGFVIVGAIGIAIVFGFLMAAEQRKGIAFAKGLYEENLNLLKTSPADPQLRQQALASGRRYAERLRNGGGVGLFDEVALMNDLNAASAGANMIATAISPSETTLQKHDVCAKFSQLNQLRESQLISEDEFHSMRAVLLKDFSGSV
jgi:hypothetical protein